MDYTTKAWQLCGIFLFEDMFKFFVDKDTFLMAFVRNFNSEGLYYKFMNRNACNPWKEKNNIQYISAFWVSGEMINF